MSSPQLVTSVEAVQTLPPNIEVETPRKQFPEIEEVPDYVPPKLSSLLAVEDSDYHMAKLVKDMYGHRIAVMPPDSQSDGGVICTFNPADGLWYKGRSHEIRNMVTKAADLVRKAALGMDPQNDTEKARQKKLIGTAFKYYNAGKRRDAASVLCDNRDLIQPADRWETAELEIPFSNGYKLNARTGEVGVIKPEDRFLFTMNCALPRDYERDVEDSFVVGVIRQIFEGREDLIEFFREALFYTLLGQKQDKAFFYIQGPGNTGKTVLLVMLHALMGKYWELADGSVIEVNKDGGDAGRFILGRFEYSRCLAVDETGAGRNLNAQMLKGMTGGNEVECERKFQERTRYAIRFALWIASNFEPNFIHDDGAAVDRLCLIRLSRVFKKDERNRNLKILDTWRPHVQDLFRWIWGARDRYWENRLSERPEKMLSDIAQNSRDNDPLGQALEYLCERVEGSSVSVVDMFKNLKLWRKAHGNSERYGSKLMKQELRGKGFRIDDKDMIQGVQFNTDNVEELENPSEWSLSRR